ncbi:MAG: glycoside hydrolase family 95-like protein, partial [Mucilaginibacter sp.]
LPDEWAAGSISGLKARGNFEVAIKWKDKKIVTASVLSVVGGKCRVRSNQPLKIKELAVRCQKDALGYVTEILTQKGRAYHLIGM